MVYACACQASTFIIHSVVGPPTAEPFAGEEEMGKKMLAGEELN